jgi:L-asparaginase
MAFNSQSQSQHKPKEQRKPLFKPALILHGGAGNIQRSRLPPELYERYRSSLLTYLRSTAELLKNGPGGGGGEGDEVEYGGCSALDAAVHAVSLMEDDELFNCGRGSVFTTAGAIEMEASVMVTSVVDGSSTQHGQGMVKRGAGVMLVKNVRHPIQLAKEVLLRTGHGDANGGSMHCQLSGPHVEKLARDWGLEFKPDEWFWTRKRWDEHRRALDVGQGKAEATLADDALSEEGTYLSQGTVGCVCLDQWGNLAVATSTGGMTNKLPGRIGDTPTLGAGFWAEAWDEDLREEGNADIPSPLEMALSMFRLDRQPGITNPSARNSSARRRRAVALSGTGNGDSFLRTAAARTVGAMCRFSSRPHVALTEAISAVSGPGGELQRSAGSRWGLTGEGAGGIIGIEAQLDYGEDDQGKRSRISGCGENNVDSLRRGTIVADFNCGGMFRAWIEEDEDGKESERMRVFQDEYR